MSKVEAEPSSLQGRAQSEGGRVDQRCLQGRANGLYIEI